MKRISIAKAKKELSSVVADVERGAERYVLEDDGRPVAAVVSLEDLEKLQGAPAPVNEEPKGALALVGLWADLVTDEEMDRLIEDIYTARERDIGRPPPDFGLAEPEAEQ